MHRQASRWRPRALELGAFLTPWEALRDSGPPRRRYTCADGGLVALNDGGNAGGNRKKDQLVRVYLICPPSFMEISAPARGSAHSSLSSCMSRSLAGRMTRFASWASEPRCLDDADVSPTAPRRRKAAVPIAAFQTISHHRFQDPPLDQTGTSSRRGYVGRRPAEMASLSDAPSGRAESRVESRRIHRLNGRNRWPNPFWGA